MKLRYDHHINTHAEAVMLLQAFCEHVAEGEALQLMIEKVRRKAMTDDECFARYKVLCTMKEVQTRAALSCPTGRLTAPFTRNSLRSK